MRLSVGPPTFWSDSATGLGWIQSKSYCFKTFVGHRVGEILEESDATQWQHVPGALNPANDASRGLYPRELTNEHRWLEGPAFLRQGAEQCPASKKFVPVIDDPEVTSTPTKYITAIVKTTKVDHGKDAPATEPQTHQFIGTCVSRPCLNPPTRIQQDSSARRSVFVASDASRRISPFLDGRGLLRAGGRLKNGPFSFETRHPLVLGNSRITEVLMWGAHLSVRHSGAERTLTEF